MSDSEILLACSAWFLAGGTIGFIFQQCRIDRLHAVIAYYEQKESIAKVLNA